MMLNADALKVAADVIEILKPGCVRIEVAGSIRRLASHVKDIEIVAVPDLKPLHARKPEFGKPLPVQHKTSLDRIVYDHGQDSEDDDYPWQILKNGPKYKRFHVKKSMIAVDLFLVTPPAQWGVLSIIRTGPADFSHWMVTCKSLGGALPDQYIVDDGVVGQRARGQNGGYIRIGEMPMPEEIDFFKLCGLEYIDPHERVAKWRK